MGLGYLKVETRTLDDNLPVSGATVVIKDNTGKILHRLITDESGNTEPVGLYAPDKIHTLSPDDPGPFFSTYEVNVIHPQKYITEIIRGVQIFDTVTTILPVTMLPKPRTGDYVDIIDIPHTQLSDTPRDQAGEPPIVNQSNIGQASSIQTSGLNRGREQVNSRQVQEFVLSDVLIPDYLIVHLGPPATSASNVKVAFKDYIKNVASHEIYPTWPENSLRTNIYAIITFALNRVFTEWYKSRGYNFDITNSTAYDQSYVHGGEIYQSVSVIVDEIFNSFARRQGRREPFFTQFCNGTTVTCRGLSQWGTVTLANQGLTPIQMLRYYYPNDIQIATSNNIASITESYPGRVLLQGSQSNAVRTMQRYLNRIRTNYPLIPLISNPNGFFDSETTQAVRTFQGIFNLTQDGVIGRATWYEIVRLFVGITKLADMASEGIRIAIGTTPPTTTLTTGSRGEAVVELQYILNYIAEFYPIPSVIESGIYDSTTRASVVEFQKLFDLTADGVVGPATWRMLYNVYNGIDDNVDIPEVPEVTPPPTTVVPAYPGTPLSVGSTGINVLLIQEFLNVLSTVHTVIPRLIADGVFGNLTRSAVIAFQSYFGLTPDGVVGPATWNKIVSVYTEFVDSGTPPYPGTPLRVGSRGANVVLMQRYLNSMRTTYPSIPALTVDGIFGSGTQSAVITFQKLVGLTADRYNRSSYLVCNCSKKKYIDYEDEMNFWGRFSFE